MKATLLFDLDGTLVETDHLHFRAFQSIFTPHGVEIDWDVYKAEVLGKANPVIAARFLPHLPVEQHAAVMDAKEAAYRDLATDLEAASGVLDLLDWADQEGIPCGIVTNAPRANAELAMRALNLGHRFQTMVIGDELPHAKPHPLPYLTALKNLGGDAAVSVAFEDSPSGARAAVAAGLGVAGILTSVDGPVLTGVGVGVVSRDFSDPALIAFVKERTAPGRRTPASHS